MKKRRSDLLLLIRKDEQSKEELEKELASVKRRLSKVCDTLNERLQKKAFYDDAIENSEAAYSKVSHFKSLMYMNIEVGRIHEINVSRASSLFQILESSQALLNVVRLDAQALDSAADTNKDSRT